MLGISSDYFGYAVSQISPAFLFFLSDSPVVAYILGHSRFQSLTVLCWGVELVRKMKSNFAWYENSDESSEGITITRATVNSTLCASTVCLLI